MTDSPLRFYRNLIFIYIHKKYFTAPFFLEATFFNYYFIISPLHFCLETPIPPPHTENHVSGTFRSLKKNCFFARPIFAENLFFLENNFARSLHFYSAENPTSIKLVWPYYYIHSHLKGPLGMRHFQCCQFYKCNLYEAI